MDESNQRPAPPVTRRRTRARTVALCLGALVVLYAATELLLFTAISIKFGRLFSFDAFEARPRQLGDYENPFRMPDVPARIRIRKEVLHPYLGFVYDPSVEQSSPHGISDVSPIQEKSADKVIVGIFGGSFADDVASHMGAELGRRLERYFPDRQFVVVKAAIGGYKQPQQLMALNYFTALGGDFDIVINIDGFNEIALPVLENLPNTNPFFPRQWHLRLQAVPDPELIATIGRIKFLDSAAWTWSDFFYTGPLRYSVTANTIWRIGDQLLYNAAVENRLRLPRLAEGGGFAATGPPAPFPAGDELYAALARTWAESSYQMNAVSRAKGIRYFHFLQPNQYLDGSKPMGPQERRIAVKEDHPYAQSVRQGYPVLTRLGRDLVDRGVHFVDLTDVFADTRDAVYRDNCCHVNIDGLRIVTAAIANAIAATITSGTPAATGD